MPTFQNLLAVAAIFTLLLSVVEFLKGLSQRMDDLIELQWKQIEMFSRILEDNEVMHGFRTRTGRLLRPKQD